MVLLRLSLVSGAFALLTVGSSPRSAAATSVWLPVVTRGHPVATCRDGYSAREVVEMALIEAERNFFEPPPGSLTPDIDVLDRLTAAEAEQKYQIGLLDKNTRAWDCVWIVEMSGRKPAGSSRPPPGVPTPATATPGPSPTPQYFRHMMTVIDAQHGRTGLVWLWSEDRVPEPTRVPPEGPVPSPTSSATPLVSWRPSSLAQSGAAPSVAGVVESVRRRWTSDEAAEAYAYAMPSSQDTFAYPSGEVGLGRYGLVLLAVPDFAKAAGPTAPGTNISVMNAVGTTGFTNFATYVTDSQRQADFLCQELHHNMREYLGHDSWGYLNAGFRGSVLISADFWEHDLFDDTGMFVRNRVGLAAVADRWAKVPGAGVDGAHAAVAVPIYVAQGMDGGTADGTPLCPWIRHGPPPGEPTPTGSPTPTMTPEPASPRYNSSAPQIHLPALLAAPGLECTPSIAIQNAGSRSARAVVLVWSGAGECGPKCRGPARAICAGPIAPGTTWHVSAAELGDDADSAVVYSFDPDALEAAVPPCADPNGCACEFEAMFANVLGSCDEFAAFDRAYSSGGSYAGVSLRTVVGPALGATVRRDCRPPAADSITAVEAYRGIAGPEIGAVTEQAGRYTYALPHLIRTAPDATVIRVQNAGTECAAVRLLGYATEGTVPCASVSVAPGASVSLSPATCTTGAGTSAFLDSTQPVAVVVDITSAGTLISYAGIALTLRLPDGPPLFAPSSDVAFAPLIYARYEGWSSRLHLQNTGSLPEVFKVTFTNVGPGPHVVPGPVEITTERQFGPVEPGETVTVDVSGLGDLPDCWVGVARVESFPASAAPVSTPWSGAEPTQPATCGGGTEVTATPSANPRGAGHVYLPSLTVSTQPN